MIRLPRLPSSSPPLIWMLALGVLCFASESPAANLGFNNGTFADGPEDDLATAAAEDVLSFGFRFHDENVAPDITNALVETNTYPDFPGENRLRSSDFGGILTMTHESGLPFELSSFRLANFTYNAGHTHGLEVTYNYADLTSEMVLFTVGTEIPGDRATESADIVVNKSNLTSVVFANTQRLVYVDDIVARVPEPTTVLLGLVAVGWVGTVLRRRPL